MKKIKRNIAKKYFHLCLIFVLLVLTIALSSMLSWQNPGNYSGTMKAEKQYENVEMIRVLFHKTGEYRNVELEEYLEGVLPAEMPPSFHPEALKAQAVAARTYILNRRGFENEQHKDAVVCTDSTHCKAYMSDEDARHKWGSEWDKTYRLKIKKAVEETKGLIITYLDEPISAVFHSTSSGKTENSEDVWQNALPYLRSVVSEGEEKSPRYLSEVKVSLDEFNEIIKKLNSDAVLNNNPQSWIGDIKYNESGSVKEIFIGSVLFKGTEIRSAFSLRSANFKIKVDDKNIIFSVVGNGHGVGMSQYGANFAAENGYTFEQILKKYYSGIEIKKMNNN